MTGRTLTAGVLAATLALGSLAPHQAAADSTNKDLEKALAALVAIGIVAAAAKHNKDDDGWDEDRYGEPFSPSPNVVCLPIPRRCYKNGHLSMKWTERIFG
ncbi:hypothetical protein [Rhodovulum steppense]|uniref:Uncharacterized protein n=1 Tax=Rhodovulum steppense TaxID=540251 RepID=A0A4R1YLS3_9RHOB|nr:hypothetical protein [Rhodovulum steppense]TCM78375.1 hypothetical protein EV216_12652 [Rhodovulum steppense]